MKYIATQTGKTKSGKFKVYIWGQPDWHISDWTGTNYRLASVKGQPHRGFTTRFEAETFARSKFSTEEAAKSYARIIGDGSFLAEDRAEELALEDVDFSREYRS